MNAYSIIHNFDQPAYQPDFRFVAQALGYKQQKLDVNRQKIQSLYDHFSALDVTKGIHQEYVDKRLREILDINKNYHSMDLSDDNFASVVAGNVTQIMDDIVIGAVTDKRVMDFENKQWEEARLKNDGSYSTANHAEAMMLSDRQGYLQDEELGRRYKGGAGFRPYADYNKKFMDNIGKIEERLEAEYITEGPMSGQFKSIITKEVIEPQKIREEMSRLFNQEDYRQMQTDGWHQFSQMGEENFAQMWNGKVDGIIDNYTRQKDYLQGLILGGKATASEKAEYQTTITTIDEEIQNQTKSRFENLKQNGVDINKVYGKYYQDNYLESIVRTYAKDHVIDIKLDATHAENVKLNQNISEFNQTMAFNREKFVADQLYKNDKLTVDMLSKGLTRDPKTGAIITATSSSTSLPFVIGNSTVKPEASVKVFDKILDEQFNAHKDITTTIQTAFGIEYNLRSETMKEIITGFTTGGNDAVKHNPDGTATVKVDGRTQVISKEDVVKLTDYSYKTAQENEAMQSYFQGVNSTVDYMNTTLGKMYTAGRYAKGADLEKEQILPNFSFKIVSGQNGELRTVAFEGGQNGEQHYKDLLIKKTRGTKLTPAEEKTLSLYGAYAMVLGPELEDEERRGVQAYIKQNILPGVKTDWTLLPKTTKQKGAGAIKLSKEYPTITAELTERDISERTLEFYKRTAFSQMGRVGKPHHSPTNTSYRQGYGREEELAKEIHTLLKLADNLPNGNEEREQLINKAVKLRSDLFAEQRTPLSGNTPTATRSGVLGVTARGTRVAGPYGTGGDLGSLGSEIQNRLGSAQVIAEGKGKENLERKQVIGIGPEDSRHKALSNMLTGTPGYDKIKSSKQDIMFMENADGSYTIAQNLPGLKDQTQTLEEEFDTPISYTNFRIISPKALAEAGVEVNPPKPNYVADAARSGQRDIPLGFFDPKNIAFEIKQKNVISRREVSQATENLPKEAREEMLSIYDDFIEGNVLLSLRPIQGSMYAVLERTVGGKMTEIAYEELGASLTATDLAEIRADKLVFMQSILVNFIQNMINEQQ